MDAEVQGVREKGKVTAQELPAMQLNGQDNLLQEDRVTLQKIEATMTTMSMEQLEVKLNLLKVET